MSVCMCVYSVCVCVQNVCTLWGVCMRIVLICVCVCIWERERERERERALLGIFAASIFFFYSSTWLCHCLVTSIKKKKLNEIVIGCLLNYRHCLWFFVQLWNRSSELIYTLSTFDSHSNTCQLPLGLAKDKRKTSKMDDHGTDITPDMVRPGCFPRFQRSANEQQSYSSSSGHATLPVDDLEADSSTTVGQRSDPLPPRLAYLCSLYPAYEPLDESTDSTAQVHRRVFERQRQQASNGTSYYKSEENRLSTFVDWRYQRIVRKEDLAKNGFVFTGTGDKVSLLDVGLPIYILMPDCADEMTDWLWNIC